MSDDFRTIDDLWADVRRETDASHRSAELAELNDRVEAGDTLTNEENRRRASLLSLAGLLATVASGRPLAPMPEPVDNKPPSQAEVARLMLETFKPKPKSLDDLANAIRVTLKKSDDYLLTAGKFLAEARQRVADGETGLTWKGWLLQEKIGVEKARLCLRIVASADPDAEVATHREAVRQRVEKHRSTKATTACYVTGDRSDTDTAGQVREAWSAMPPDDRMATGLIEAPGAKVYDHQSWRREFFALWERCPNSHLKYEVLAALGIDGASDRLALPVPTKRRALPDEFSVASVEAGLRRRRR